MTKDKKESYPLWVYHAEKDAKIIDSEDLANAKKSGWKESPADCKK